MEPPSPRLTVTLALDAVWAAALTLPDDEESFRSLTPDERRAAHDLGVRVQDRVVRALSRLVEGMAEDGVELVDDRGVLIDYGAGSVP